MFSADFNLVKHGNLGDFEPYLTCCSLGYFIILYTDIYILVL